MSSFFLGMGMGMNEYPRNFDVEDDVCEGYEWLKKGDFNKAASIANKALGTDPACFQAIGLQAEIAWKRTPADFAKALRLMDEAVRVAEGVQPVWASTDTLVWGWIDNRPYMRLLHQKALIHGASGDLTAALSVAKRLLRANPDDNQGIRTLAANWMVRRGFPGDWNDLDALLSEFVEGTSDPTMTFAFALRGFIRAAEGSITKLERDHNLRKAMWCNPSVPQNLLDGVPSAPIDYVSRGNPEEAKQYAMMNRDMWTRVDGALGWLQASRACALPTEAELVHALDTSKCIIIKFRKANGEIRDIIATRKLRDMPFAQRPKSGHVQAHVKGAAIQVYEKTHFAGWRSFKYDSVIEVPFYRILTLPPSQEEIQEEMRIDAMLNEMR